jgi:hypothetical protein
MGALYLVNIDVILIDSALLDSSSMTQCGTGMQYTLMTIRIIDLSVSSDGLCIFYKAMVVISLTEGGEARRNQQAPAPESQASPTSSSNVNPPTIVSAVTGALSGVLIGAFLQVRYQHACSVGSQCATVHVHPMSFFVRFPLSVSFTCAVMLVAASSAYHVSLWMS